MKHPLLEAWNTIDKSDHSIKKSIIEEKQKRPWFCLPHMLEAKLSGEADDLMHASMYAPDRARLHEWAAEEAEVEANHTDSHRATARPFSLMAFHPPENASTGGTGALDTKVQLIVSQHFDIAQSIKRALYKTPKPVVNKKPEALVSSSEKTKETLSTVTKPSSTTDSIVYHGKRGVDIPISISKEQYALFDEGKIPQKQPEKRSADPLGGFKLRPAKDLENVQPDASVKSSIEQNALPPSETMAKLLAAQGNTQDAIAIYEQLILASPEKSTYFVAQIEKIKQP